MELEGPDARSSTGWALHVEGNDHPYFPPPAFWGGWRENKNREVHNFLIYVFLSLKPLKQPSITLIIRIKVVTNSILLFLEATNLKHNSLEFYLYLQEVTIIFDLLFRASENSMAFSLTFVFSSGSGKTLGLSPKYFLYFFIEI